MKDWGRKGGRLWEEKKRKIQMWSEWWVGIKYAYCVTHQH